MKVSRRSSALYEPMEMISVRSEGAAIDTFIRLDPHSFEKLLLFFNNDVSRNDRMDKSMSK